MKKIQSIAHHFVVTSTLIAAGLLAQACGSSTGNVSAVTATTDTGGTSCVTTNTCGTTVSGGTVYSSCAYYGGSTTTVTSNGTNVSVCRYTVTQSQSFDIQAASMSISGSSASGGTITNIQLDQGDKLEIVSFGHYTPTGGHCPVNWGTNGSGDISVLGNSNGKDPSTDPSNGLNVGLWYAFENSSGQYSTPVNATVQYSSGSSSSFQTIQVPMGSTTNNLVMGYNWSGSIGCGDMGAYYTVIRCVDTNGTTYTCN